MIISSILSFSSIEEKSEINKKTGNLSIIQKTSNLTKEEALKNMNEIINEYDIGNIFEIFGNDYNLKISPINIKKFMNISTYILFLSCEEKLRNSYKLPKDSIISVYQIEIKKDNDNSITNQVEYAIFDENRTKLNLSICSNELIKIYYGINNSSVLNLDLPNG
jgi:hypothetical protein